MHMYIGYVHYTYTHWCTLSMCTEYIPCIRTLCIFTAICALFMFTRYVEITDILAHTHRRMSTMCKH